MIAILLALFPMWFSKVFVGVTEWSVTNVILFIVNGFVQGAAFASWLSLQGWRSFWKEIKDDHDKKYGK